MIRYLESRLPGETRKAIIPSAATDEQIDNLRLNTLHDNPWSYYEVWCKQNGWILKYKSRVGRPVTKTL